MADVESVKIESDERGFELHIVVGEDIDVDEQGRAILNVQAVAEELFDAVKSSIGPYLAERDEAKREYDAAGGHPMCPDEDGRCIHGRDDECPRVSDDFFDVLRRDEAVRYMADIAGKVAKGE